MDGTRTNSKWKTSSGEKIFFDEIELAVDGVKGNALSYNVEDGAFMVLNNKSLGNPFH